jgi:hypothetical protein
MTVAAFGVDISGRWQMTVETDKGSGSPEFVLKQKGTKLTGTYKGKLGEAAVVGTIVGNNVELTFESWANLQKNMSRYSGKLDDVNHMKGAVDLGKIGGKGTFTGEKQ